MRTHFYPKCEPTRVHFDPIIWCMEIDPKLLKRSPFQLRSVRKTTRAYCQLRSSVKRQGILQPILIRDFEIVDGAHRHEVALDLRLPTVPCLRRELTDEEVLAAQVAANTQRIKTLDADLAKRLWKITKKMPIDQVAYNMGRSTSWVHKVCGLEKLTAESLELFDRGGITFRQAYLLSNIPRKYQGECLGLPEAELQHIVRELKASGRLPDRRIVSPMYRPLGSVLEEMERPNIAGRIIMNETDHSPIEIWKAALRWVTQMDGETLERREKRSRMDE